MHTRSLTNPACNAQPYCHLQPVWLHHILQHYLMNSKIFGKNLLYIKFIFWFPLQLWFKKFLILRIIQSYIVINVKSLHVKCPFLLNFNTTWILTDFWKKKSSNIMFHQNLSRDDLCCSTHTDRQTTYEQQILKLKMGGLLATVQCNKWWFVCAISASNVLK